MQNRSGNLELVRMRGNGVTHTGYGPAQGRPEKSPGYGGRNLKKGDFIKR